MTQTHIRNNNTIVALKLKFNVHIDPMDCYDRIRSVTQGLSLAIPARAHIQQLHPNTVLIKQMSCSPNVVQRLTKLLNPSPDERAQFVSYNLESLLLVSKHFPKPRQTAIPPVDVSPHLHAEAEILARQQVGYPIVPTRPPPREVPLTSQVPHTNQAPSVNQISPMVNPTLLERTLPTQKQTVHPQRAGVPMPCSPPNQAVPINKVPSINQLPAKPNLRPQDKAAPNPKQTVPSQRAGVSISPPRPPPPPNNRPASINQLPPKPDIKLEDETTSIPKQTTIHRQQVGVPTTSSRPSTGQVTLTSRITPKANSSSQERTTPTSSSVPKVAQTQLPTPRISPQTDAPTHTVTPPRPRLTSESQPSSSPVPSQRKHTISEDGEDIVRPPMKRPRIAEPDDVTASPPTANSYAVLSQKYIELQQKQKPLEDTISELRAALENRDQTIASKTKTAETEKARFKMLVQNWNAKFQNENTTHQKNVENLKQELESERELRLKAEKIVEDIRVERTHPFVVPGLIDAFILIMQNRKTVVPEDEGVSPTDTVGPV